MAGKGSPTTPTSMVAGDDQFMMDHMYRLDALKMLAQSGISHPSEQDIKAIAIKLRQKEEQGQQEQAMAAMQAHAAQMAQPPAPNLIAPPGTMPAAAAPVPAPGPAMVAGGGLNIAQALAALQGGGGQ